MTERPITLRVTAECLMPADAHSAKAIAAMEAGSLLRVKPAKGRSLPQLRLYWALLEKVVEAGAPFANAEALHVALKMAMGLADLVKLPNGKVVPVPRSTAIDAMPADEFQRFFDRAVDLICQHILPDCDKAALVAEAHDMIAPKVAA